LLIVFAPYIGGSNASSSLIGSIASLVAAISYAFGHIWGKMHLSRQKPYIAPAAQLIMSSLFLIPVALFFDDPPSLPIPSWKAISGVLGLACCSTTLALILYYKLLEHSDPTAISVASCFLPVSGLLLGAIFLDESITLSLISATLLILTGLIIINEL